MFGGVILALGAIGTIKQTIHEDMLEYEFLEMEREVPGDIFTHNGEKYIKGLNEKVTIVTNCFGETYAYGNNRLKDGIWVSDVYGVVEVDYCPLPKGKDCGLDDTTYFANGFGECEYGTASHNLYIDKETGQRLCEWNGIYFDADTSVPVRFVNQDQIKNFDLRKSNEKRLCNNGTIGIKGCGWIRVKDIDFVKIWIANEVLKDKAGLSFWQCACGYDASGEGKSALEYMLPGIDFIKEENFDKVEFREKCRKVCRKIPKGELMTLSSSVSVPDTNYSMTEWKRRTMDENKYRVVI